MEQSEIISMAREAGFSGHSPNHVFVDPACLERFATLVLWSYKLFQSLIAGERATEREACAKVVETTHAEGLQSIREACAAAIRART